MWQAVAAVGPQQESIRCVTLTFLSSAERACQLRQQHLK